MSNPKIMIPNEWDVDIMDYWHASLSSYEKHHQDVNQTIDSNQVTSEFIQSLPIKSSTVEQTTAVETMIPKSNVTASVPQPSAAPVTTTATTTHTSVKRKTSTAPTPLTPSIAVQQSQEEIEEESLVGNWTFVDSTMGKEKEKEMDRQLVNDNIHQEEEKEEQEEEDYTGEDETSRQYKKARYDQTYDYSDYNYNQQQQPPQVPPDDGLSNLIMAWYYAGYYTGLYQAGNSNRQ